MMGRHAFAGTVVAYAAGFMVAYLVLPDRVPAHFGWDGTVDRYDDRGTTLVFLAIFGAAMIALLGGLAYWTPKMPEHMINMPVRTREWWFATAEREQVLRRNLADDMWWIGAMTMALFVVVEACMIVASRGPAPTLPWWFGVAFVAYLIAMIGYVVWMTRVRHAVPPEQTD